MCLLTYFPPTIPADVDRLYNGADYNPDGHGFAIVTDERIIIGHGLSGPAVVDRFNRLRQKNPGGPALFHSRIGTHGSMGQENCHPFYLGKDRKTVIAHNGILPLAYALPADDPRSDTHYFATEYVRRYPQWANLTTRKGRRRVARWMGRGNKMAILTINPAYAQSSYLLNASQGEWVDNVWYSNSSFEGWPKYQKSYGKSYDDETGRVWDCPVCQAKYTVTVSNWCRACKACLDCMEDLADCQCYYPTRPALYRSEDRWTDRTVGITYERDPVSGDWLPVLGHKSAKDSAKAFEDAAEAAAIKAVSESHGWTEADWEQFLAEVNAKYPLDQHGREEATN